MFNLNELDRIELSLQKVFELFHWRDNNKGLVNNYKQVIPEGIVNVIGGMTIYFKFIDSKQTVYEASTDGIIICKLKTERLGGQYRILESWVFEDAVKTFNKIDPTFTEMDLIMDVSTTVSTCMAYLDNFKSEVIERVEPIRMSNKQYRRAEWHSRHNSNKVIKHGREVVM